MWTISLYRLIFLRLGGLWVLDISNAGVAEYMGHAPKRATFEEALVSCTRARSPKLKR